jgi:hypothetical protein
MYTIDIEKTPYEERTYEFDLVALLASGETLAAVDGISFAPQAATVLTASGSAIAEGTKVRARLTGGSIFSDAPWSDHAVSVRAITSFGHKVEGLFRLRVLEAPVR